MKYITAILLFCNVAFADINSAIENYKNKKFKKAYAEFKILSDLGYSTPHHYLAKMLMNGEGVEKSLLKAYAWSKLSERENNDNKKLTAQIQEKLTKGELIKAKIIIGKHNEIYAYDNLKYNITERANPTVTFEILPEKTKTKVPLYPIEMARKKQEGYVSFSFYVYPDGSVRDIYIEKEFPVGGFTKEALMAISQYNIGYKLNGENRILEKPMYGLQLIKFKLSKDNTYSSVDENYAIETRKKAIAGDAWAGFQYYNLYMYHPKKKEPISQETINQWLINASNKGYIDAQYVLGRNMYYALGIIKQEQLGIDHLVTAAVNGQKQAQYLLYKLLSRHELESKFHEDEFYWLENAVINGSINAKLEFVKYISKLQSRDKKSIKRAKKYLKQYAKTMAKTTDWYQAKALLEAKKKQYSQAHISINHAIKTAKKAHWDLTELKAQRKLIKKRKQIY